MSTIRHWDPRIRVLGFLLLSFTYLAWSYTSELGSFGGDNAIYLLSADYLSPFGSPSPLAASYFASSQYPPLFPLVLGILGANADLLVAHLAVTSFLLAALLVLYKWQRSLSISPWWAFALTLLFACLPGTYFQTLEILSENLYLLFSLLGLWMYRQAEMTRREDWLLGAAVVVAAATLTRTAGVTLLAALLIHLVFLKRSGRNAMAAVIALAPVAVWHLWRGGGGYVSSLATTYGANPIAAFLDRLSLQATALWYGWIDNFASAPPLAIVIAITAFGAICLTGLAGRLYARSLDGLYVSFYLLLMLIWPFPGESQRFVFPILPILMVQGFWLLGKLPGFDVMRKRIALAPVVTLTALALVTLPQSLLHLHRFTTPLPTELLPFKHTAGWYHPDANIAAYQIHHSARVAAALKTAGTLVPPDDCILSIKPSIVSYYTKRFSKSPPAGATPITDFNREMEQRSCSYLFLVAFSSPTFNEPFYPLGRLNGRVVVLEETRLAGADSPTVAMLARLSAHQSR
jgi:hypothetical protein